MHVREVLAYGFYYYIILGIIHTPFDLTVHCFIIVIATRRRFHVQLGLNKKNKNNAENS